MENNYYENDEFDKSQFYDLFRDIKNEIKDKVITRLLITVQNYYKELNFLREENISLKNHLAYILKRIILQKNDYNNTSINQNSLNRSEINIKKSRRNNSYLNKRSHPLKNKKPDRMTTTLNYFSPKNANIAYDSNDNSDNENNQTSTIFIDNKVNKYLRNIYKKEISNNLNKSESIYTELFVSGKNKYKTIDLDEYYMDKNSESRIDNTSSKDKDYNSGNNRDKNNKISTYNIRSKKSNYGEKIKAKKDLLYMKKPPFY